MSLVKSSSGSSGSPKDDDAQVITDVTRMKREKEFHAIKLHSLESHGQSFFQVIVQVYLLFLLLILGTGTVIAGVGADKFFEDIFALTLVSILISMLNFTVTAWNLQAKDHIAKQELNPDLQTENKAHQSWSAVLTHVLWTVSSAVIYTGSLVLMSLVSYIEMFSNHLTETGFRVNIQILPFLIFLSNIPINIALYKFFIKNKDSFSLAHAILSPIKPCR